MTDSRVLAAVSAGDRLDNRVVALSIAWDSMTYAEG